MESNQILDRLKKVIIESRGLNEDEITMNSHFMHDLGMDSLILIDLLMMVEDEFHIMIPDQDAEKFAKVSDIVNYLQSKVTA